MQASHPKKSCVVFNTQKFQDDLDQLAAPFISRFFSLIRNYVLFHAVFVLLLSCEFVVFGLLASVSLQSNAIAFWLAAIFLTVFTYLVLLFYLQGRRPEKLVSLRDEYLQQVKNCIPFSLGTLEYHCCITESIVHLMKNLHISQIENRWVLASETLTYLVGKFRIWTTWKSLLKIKEMLLLSSIKEHIHLIKNDPIDLEAHASLANNYVSLASLYQDPKNVLLCDELIWSPPDYESDQMQDKFAMALERALEEYHIIQEYAPSDPWVHTQRANLYRLLERQEEEQKEYEAILALDPQNEEILSRLGKLYFRKGENAKGLQVVDQLQNLSEPLAHEVVEHYDAYPVEEYLF